MTGNQSRGVHRRRHAETRSSAPLPIDATPTQAGIREPLGHTAPKRLARVDDRRGIEGAVGHSLGRRGVMGYIAFWVRSASPKAPNLRSALVSASQVRSSAAY